MEKRLILSLALSFAVLYLWAALGPKQNPPAPLTEESQISEINELSDSSNNSTPSSDLKPLSNNTVSDIQPNTNRVDKAINEEISSIENDKLKVFFSNMGGNITHILIKEYNTTLPIEHLATLADLNNKLFAVTQVSEDRISYELKEQGLRILKEFKLSDNDYLIHAGIKLSGNSEMSSLDTKTFLGFTLNIHDQEKEGGVKPDRRSQALFEYVVHTNDTTIRKNNAYKFSDKNNKSGTGSVQWVGFRDRYFSAIIKPEFDTIGYEISQKGPTTLDITLDSENLNEWTSVIFVGPEHTELLKEYDMGFEEIKRYYRFGIFDGIAKIILWLMHLVHSLIPNWGVSIILISLLIYGCTYPLTIKSMTSMRKMQALQPKMAHIKEKHSSNPQKMNQEMMELYKKEKVNPLGGCLPMFLQLPVFIGLYQVLWRSVEFKGAGFLWIKDLSEPDRLIVLKNALPFMGTDINLLPILMMIIMFIQQKISAKNMVISDPMQAQQQKMMQTIFPIFLGVIFYKFSSGLTLYFSMFYILSAFTQWKIAQQNKAS